MILIGTYPKTFERESGLSALDQTFTFIESNFSSGIACHLLPFCINSGDGGFSMDNWFVVDPKLGSWREIINFCNKYKLIIDVVYNHVGNNSHIIKKFESDPNSIKDMIYAYPASANIRSPLSPRGGNMLRPYATKTDNWQVWRTFSDTAIDINLDNPTVEIMIDQHLDFLSSIGVYGVRMDAPAYFGKEHGDLSRHTKNSYKLCRKYSNKVKKRDFQLLAQLDCDEPAQKYYAEYSELNSCIVDFSYSAFLIEAILTGEVSKLTNHIDTTAKIGQRLLRAPRTHDGILMKSLFQSEEFVNSLCSHATKCNAEIRFINDSPYEINSSLPFLLRDINDSHLLEKRTKLLIIVTRLISDIAYLYLPFILGFVPEDYHETREFDPRNLNRIALPAECYRNKQIQQHWKPVKELINTLDKLINVNEENRIAANSSAVDKGSGLLEITNSEIGLKLVANFGKSRSFDLAQLGEPILSSDVNNNAINEYGYFLLAV